MIKALLVLLWKSIVKDLLAGVFVETAKDMIAKFVEKTPWKVIIERFVTRLLVMCLKWLTTMTSNQLVLATVNDFLGVLQGNGLREAKPILASDLL